MPFESAATYISVSILSECAKLMAINRYLKQIKITFRYSNQSQRRDLLFTFLFPSSMNNQLDQTLPKLSHSTKICINVSPFPSVSIQHPPHHAQSNGNLCSPTNRGRFNNATAHGHQTAPHLGLEEKQSQHQVCKNEVACAVLSPQYLGERYRVLAKQDPALCR